MIKAMSQSFCLFFLSINTMATIFNCIISPSLLPHEFWSKKVIEVTTNTIVVTLMDKAELVVL